MKKTATKEKVDVEQSIATAPNQIVQFEEPRLPYHEDVTNRFGVDRGQWRVLVESTFPAAQSFDAIIMALSYCKARNLDVFKRPVHIVPMWSSARKSMVETVWPGISEIRTTASRTRSYAGCDEVKFGPTIEQVFKGDVGEGQKRKRVETTVRFPEWAQLTVYRIVGNTRCAFVGPKVFWLETYARLNRWVEIPNSMWEHRAFGQLEKCAEAASLRRAFPEEVGNEYAAEEMAGQILYDAGDLVPVKQVDSGQARDSGPPIPPVVKAQEQPEEEPTPQSFPEKLAAWVIELDAAFSGCEDIVSLGEEQLRIMAPMKDAASDEEWQQAESILAEHIDRIQGIPADEQ